MVEPTKVLEEYKKVITFLSQSDEAHRFFKPLIGKKYAVLIQEELAGGIEFDQNGKVSWMDPDQAQGASPVDWDSWDTLYDVAVTGNLSGNVAAMQGKMKIEATMVETMGFAAGFALYHKR